MLFSTDWTILTFLAQYIEMALDLKGFSLHDVTISGHIT